MTQFMFCSDESRKVVVIKNEDNSSEKIGVNDFIVKYVELGKNILNDYLDNVKMAIDDRVNDDIVLEEDFNKFKPKYVEIRNFINNPDKKVLDKDPLKSVTKDLLRKSRKIHKSLVPIVS